jgi:hypothetical protein
MAYLLLFPFWLPSPLSILSGAEDILFLNYTPHVTCYNYLYGAGSLRNQLWLVYIRNSKRFSFSPSFQTRNFSTVSTRVL